MAGRSAFDRRLMLQLEELERQTRLAIRAARVDAGVSRAQAATAAGVSRGHYAEIEAGTARPSAESLTRIAVALGRRPSLALLPDTDPRVSDRHQAPMLEALLRALHPRWSSLLEVPVYRPVHGVIDCVLIDGASPNVVAIESQWRINRLEETIRWSRQKADALLLSGPLGLGQGAVPRVSRVLALAATQANRQIASEFRESLRSAYPAASADIVRTLTSPDGRWPGSGVIWFAVDGRSARLMEGEPRELRAVRRAVAARPTASDHSPTGRSPLGSA